MENQMYLTPSQVEELRELGVELESSNAHYAGVEKGSSRVMPIGVSNRIKNDGFICFAPSLQEVLEKLSVRLAITTDDGVLHCATVKINLQQMTMKLVDGLRGDLILSPLFVSDNLLVTAFHALKWVATHHPDKIK